MTEPTYGNRLARQYGKMMERVKLHLDELEKAEKAAFPRLSASIEHAAEKAVILGDLTREEARLIGGYLKRDMEDASQYVVATGRDLRAWMRFDLELIEDRLLEFFEHGVDQSRLELSAFEQPLTEAVLEAAYRSGEVTGPGTLRCENCGEQVVFYAPTLISPCPICQGTSFMRLAEDL
ncbi:MAG: zinc ribbon-containing protein [Candidatus Competibacter denitrificans]|jgi:hypothetical protein